MESSGEHFDTDMADSVDTADFTEPNHSGSQNSDSHASQSQQTGNDTFDDLGVTASGDAKCSDKSPAKRTVRKSEDARDNSPSPRKQVKVDDEQTAGNDSDVDVEQVDENKCEPEQSAEEIVQKLCKNGKVLTLTEGEKYFKVIVYEDSEENQDENSSRSNVSSNDGGQSGQQNLLDLQKLVGELEDDTKSQHETPKVLTESTNNLNDAATVVTQTAAQIIPLMPQPILAEPASQWYSDVCTPTGYNHSSPAAAIQSNFAQTMSQFAPSFLTCNLQDLPDSSMQIGSDNMTASNQKLFCTPHPKNGQYMFYYTDENNTRSSFIPFTSTPIGRPGRQKSNKSKTPVAPSSLTLNSSGEENQSPPEHLQSMPSVSASEKQSRLPRPKQLDTITDLDMITDENGLALREQHNQKERRRRARIKEACDLMRQLVPGMSDKTDKATVFEFGARYIHFLKSFVGTEHDKDFLMKYSPY